MLLNIAVLVACALICRAAFNASGTDRYRSALLLVMAAGLVLRLHASSDRCLHMWDERFHALVAKNLLLHPLTPTLFDNPVLPYDYRDWTANQIWLEKGPVSLWALSGAIGLFGNDELAVRVPSVVLSLLSVYLTFLIASRLFDRDVAILAAFFHAINGLLVELAAGRVSSDHVDTFFVFFVELGVYLAVCHLNGDRRWFIAALIGAATGMAAMSKWFPALIVFPIWTAGLLARRSDGVRASVRALLVAAGACLVVIGPFLLYATATFPREAAWVFQKYFLALTTTIDGHAAPWYFYGEKIGVVFGELIYLPLLFVLVEIARRRANWKLAMLTVWWLLPVLVFSLAVTKRVTYVLVAAPAFFIVASYYWRRLYASPAERGYRWARVAVLILLIALPVRYSIDRITPFENRFRTPQWSPAVKLLRARLGARQKVVVFNVEHNIEAMFYSGITIYSFIPDANAIDHLARLGYHVVINDDGRTAGTLPVSDRVEILKLVAAGER